MMINFWHLQYITCVSDVVIIVDLHCCCRHYRHIYPCVTITVAVIYAPLYCCRCCRGTSAADVAIISSLFHHICTHCFNTKQKPSPCYLYNHCLNYQRYALTPLSPSLLHHLHHNHFHSAQLLPTTPLPWYLRQK